MKFRILILLTLVSLNISCANDPPLNVLLFTFDTTRADALGCYGNSKSHTPNLDRLAAEGVLFENCLSSAPLTMPAHSTILTGTNPNVHGVRDNGAFILAENQTTLAEILGGSGYATGAAIGAFVLDKRFGIAQGFDHFDCDLSQGYENFWGDRLQTKNQLFYNDRPAPQVNDAILPWLRQNKDRPWFAWIHYWDPHHPRTPPAPYNELFPTDPYQAEIAYADEALGMVIDELEKMGVKDRTIVIMVADHGEGLGEHNEETHSILCYNTTLHVPLMIWTPGCGSGLRVRERVGSVDIVPTVLDLLDLPQPGDVQGRSLVPLLFEDEDPGGAPPPYYAETISPRLSHNWGELRTWTDGPFKLIYGPRPELYNLDDDPHELHDLIEELPEQSQTMTTMLAQYITETSVEPSETSVTETDPEILQRLEALGYITTRDGMAETTRDTLRSDGTPPQDRVGDVNKVSAVKSFLAETQYLAAKEIAGELVGLDPSNPHYHIWLAWAEMGLGQLDVAASNVEMLPKLPSGETALVLEIVRRLAVQGEYERSLNLINRVIEVDRKPYALAMRGFLYKDLGDEVRHLQAFHEALQEDETYVPARLHIAVMLAEQGSFTEAAEQYEIAIRYDPLNPHSHFDYGKVLVELESADRAAPHFKRAIELSPEYWKAHIALIAVLHQLGQIDEADAAYNNLVEICSDDTVLEEAEKILMGF